MLMQLNVQQLWLSGLLSSHNSVLGQAISKWNSNLEVLIRYGYLASQTIAQLVCSKTMTDLYLQHVNRPSLWIRMVLCRLAGVFDAPVF